MPLPMRSGNRPVQLKKSAWDERQVVDKKTGKPVKRVMTEKPQKPDKRAKAQAAAGAPGFGGPPGPSYYSNR